MEAYESYQRETNDGDSYNADPYRDNPIDRNRPGSTPDTAIRVGENCPLCEASGIRNSRGEPTMRMPDGRWVTGTRRENNDGSDGGSVSSPGGSTNPFGSLCTLSLDHSVLYPSETLRATWNIPRLVQSYNVNRQSLAWCNLDTHSCNLNSWSSSGWNTLWSRGRGAVGSGGSRTISTGTLPEGWIAIRFFGDHSFHWKDIMCYTTVSVENPPPPPPPSVSVRANPSSITRGDASTISWSVSNATRCSASGGWTGNKSTAGGSQTVYPSASANFYLNCNGPGGSDSDRAYVSVSPPPPTVTLEAEVNDSGTWLRRSPTPERSWFDERWSSGERPWFGESRERRTFTDELRSAQNTIAVSPLDRIKLRWTSENTSTCDATEGTGFGFATGGAVQGTDPIDTPQTPEAQQFTVSCRGINGTTRSASIFIAADIAPPELTADPRVVRSGEDVTLTYDTGGADPARCVLAGVGTRPITRVTGTQIITPTSTGDYALSCGGGNPVVVRVMVLPRMDGN